jgi:hypothetical protein
MALRWTAAGMLEAERQFRRIIGYRDLAKLAPAVEREIAQTVTESPTEVPGSARVLASVGDDRNALLMLTVDADFGRRKVTLPAARLYLLDEDDKIKVEQVVFYAASD